MIALAWLANLGVFVAELIAVGGIGVGVWRLVDHPVLRWVVAAVVVAVVIALWARGAAPTADVSPLIRWSVRIAVFAAAAVLLGATVSVPAGVAFAVASAILWILVTVLPAPPGLRPE